MNNSGKLQETKDWQEIELPEFYGLGSFNKIKIQLIQPYLFLNSSGKVQIKEETLPTAKGYWCLDGREFSIYFQKKLYAIFHTEDCGLGRRKVNCALDFFGFKQ